MSDALVASIATVDPNAGDPRREIRTGRSSPSLFFVVFLGWAAFVPLDAGVHAAGTIAVSGNRQTRPASAKAASSPRSTSAKASMSHAGQVLIELSAPELARAERALTSDYLTLLAQRARLMAERAGQRDFAPPAEFASLTRRGPRARGAGDGASALRDARPLGVDLGPAIRARRSAPAARRAASRATSSSARPSIEQQKLIGEELDGLKAIAAKGFASMNRVRELERAQADLEGPGSGDDGRICPRRRGHRRNADAVADRSAAAGSKQIERDLKDTQAKLSEMLPKLVATREQLQHSQVRAPATGQVVGLNVFTVGGVVAPGQTLMDIVPDGRELVIQAQVAADRCRRRLSAARRRRCASSAFTTARCRCSPARCGRCRRTASPTRKAAAPFSAPRSSFRESELASVRSVLGNGELRPGLPVEAVLTVRKRTALQYLIEPLTGALWRSGHED